MPATMQDPGRCNCPGAGCASPTIVGTVTGCNGGGVDGVTVTAHDATSGGTVLGSTTTAGGGAYSLSGLTGQVIGNDIVLVMTHTRLVTTSRTLAYADPFGGFNFQWGCGHSTPTAATAMTAAAGYHCTGPCALPVADTLFLTDSAYGGPVTLTYAAGSWTGSQSISFGGTGALCGSCAASAATVSYVIDSSLQLTVGVTGGATDCPGNIGGGVSALPVGLPITCPPSFLLSGTITSGSWTAAIIQHLYTCATVGFTVTE